MRRNPSSGGLPGLFIGFLVWNPLTSRGEDSLPTLDQVIEQQVGTLGGHSAFIDRHSGLLIRDEVMPNVVFTLSYYRAIDGVLVAFTIRQATPAGVTYTYPFKDARRLASVDESRFQPR